MTLLFLDFEQDHFWVEEVLLLHVELLYGDVEIGPIRLRAPMSANSLGQLLRAGRTVTSSVHLWLLFKPERLILFNLPPFLLIVVVAVAHDQGSLSRRSA